MAAVHYYGSRCLVATVPFYGRSAFWPQCLMAAVPFYGRSALLWLQCSALLWLQCLIMEVVPTTTIIMAAVPTTYYGSSAYSLLLPQCFIMAAVPTTNHWASVVDARLCPACLSQPERNLSLERIICEGRFADTSRPSAGPLHGERACHDHRLLATGYPDVSCVHYHLASEISA
jgi:hypothetical protein